MEAKTVSLESIYIPSEGVVAREVQGEFIIVPIYSGIADMEDALFSLNETGRAIWDKLDGKNSLKGIIDKLSDDFDASKEELEEDVLGIVGELFKRRMVVEAKKG